MVQSHNQKPKKVKVLTGKSLNQIACLDVTDLRYANL